MFKRVFRGSGVLRELQDKHLLVTGGAGFMGSAFIRFVLTKADFKGRISNIDLLTYAANLDHLDEIKHDPRYRFYQRDIADRDALNLIEQKRPIDVIVHFAAETHVDRSIESPDPFVMTNVRGTTQLLNFVRDNPSIHFHQISTDEVYGALGKVGVFTEDSPYLPNSPYSASKAAADHFVRAYHRTYGLSVTISHASNNYGPCQFPEKFIPRMILNCLQGEFLPVYGKGENIREWLFVEDHAEAIWEILQKGISGEVYNIGGGVEMRNIDLLYLIIERLSEKLKRDPVDFRRLITFVGDRLGHDFRYALDGKKMKETIGWTPKHDFHSGLDKTIEWYAGAFVS